MSDMPPQDREDAVLHFLFTHGFPLPPKPIFRGLKITENITFSYRTVQNICMRLEDQGLMIRCDKQAMDNGKIKPLSPTSNVKRTYYYPTEDAMERIEDYEA